MTPVSLAFRRWISAEEDVHNASRLLGYLIQEGNAAEANAQRAVVIQLKGDAHVFLREYFYVLECEGFYSYQLKAPPSL